MGLEPDVVVQALLRERVRVTSAAVAITHDAHIADDIFQQVVLAALERRSAFREAEHVLAWVFKAARHRAIDYSRRKQLQSLPTDVLDLIESEWFEDEVGSARLEALHRCMGKIGQPAKDLLRLRYHEGLTAVAIAGRTNRSSDAVYQSLSRLHRALRECVQSELIRLESVASEGVSP